MFNVQIICTQNLNVRARWIGEKNVTKRDRCAALLRVAANVLRWWSAGERRRRWQRQRRWQSRLLLFNSCFAAHQLQKSCFRAQRCFKLHTVKQNEKQNTPMLLLQLPISIVFGAHSWRRPRLAAALWVFAAFRLHSVSQLKCRWDESRL